MSRALAYFVAVGCVAIVTGALAGYQAVILAGRARDKALAHF